MEALDRLKKIIETKIKNPPYKTNDNYNDVWVYVLSELLKDIAVLEEEDDTHPNHPNYLSEKNFGEFDSNGGHMDNHY